MHGNANDRRALEREALRNVINQWNANRLDLFELSEPNEDLEFHGVMRFYFQDSGQKVATKCIRVASDATVEDVIGTLVEKFRPDMRMLSVPSYALYELHEGCPERRMLPDEKPLLVQLNWHVDDREGRFLLKNIDDKTTNSVGSLDSNASFRRKLSKREKKQLKKQEKLSRMKSENGDINDKEDGVAEKLYTELPETSFTRSISNPEAVMRRRRQQKLEKKLQQFRSKDGGPDTGGTLKIYGEALCKDVPYKTLLLSVRDCAGAVVREMLEKYGLNKTDPSQWCLVQVTQQPGVPDTEYVLDDDECPLSILMNSPNTGSIMFHVRRRPADCAPRKRKKKPGALGTNTNNPRDVRDAVALLVELGPDGSAPHPGDTARTIRLTNDVMEVGSANGIALQLYGPHIQPRHCVITNADGVTSLTPCHADAHTYVNGQRIHQTTILNHGSLVKFGNSNTYRFLDPVHEDRMRHPAVMDNARIYDRLSGMDRYPRGQDPILPAVLEFPEDPQEQFLARVITHLDVTTPTFRLAPAYTLYLCARYRASTHYRPELTPTERAHKLTVLLQHAAMLIRHTVQDRSTESISQAFWLANASELLHFLKSDRHVSAFSIQAQDTLADAVQLAFKNLVACLTDELNSAMAHLMSVTGDDHPREVINILSGAMNLLRKCRVNAALTIQLFSQLFHWISAKALANVISNSNLCTRSFGNKLFNRLRNLQAWAESQGLELAAECHLAKIVQCAHLMQAPKYTPEDLANLSSACFKLNSMQLGALLRQYKAEPGEKLAPPPLLEQAAKAAESVADELARAEGREVTLYEDPAPPLQLLLPDDGFSCDVVQGVPPGLADFLHPLQASGLCRLAAQPTSSGHWTVYMSAPRPPSALSTTQPEVQVIRLHKAGGGMGLSIVAAKGAGQERLGIYIKSVVPGGAADRDGRLAAGDQLLSVDGQSLLGITQEKAAEFLVRTGSVVTLEVAKGGAVYHGLATLLQQPSPTPHRAGDFYAESYYSSQESLYSLNNCLVFTPPATKPKNNVFFSSDDTLYKKETRKFTIPRIEVESDEPVFNLQVTDFSEPSPKNIILGYDETGTNFETKKVEDFTVISNKSWKDKANNFVQQKSYSIDIPENPFVDIGQVGDTDKFLSISKKSRQQKLCSSSLQDLSSSTSSINSGVHESNLDLSHIDPDTPIKHKNWKSPDEVRFGQVDSQRFESKATSYPDLSDYKSFGSKSKSVSEERLNDKLTEYERLELLKLLHDWSLNGSYSKSDFNIRLTKSSEHLEKENLETSEKSLRRSSVKFSSEPNLSPKFDIVIVKYSSEDNIKEKKATDFDLMHKCEFRNCIFNEDFGKVAKPKGILKNSRERLQETECLNNLANQKTPKLGPNCRRYSEIIEPKSFNSQLVRCDSLERLTHLNKKSGHKKFPDSYIVTRRNNQRNKNSPKKSPKIIVLKKKYLPKTWKSCSDIKHRKTVRKCCRYAKKNCPILRNSSETSRKTQSCVDIERDYAARLAGDSQVGAFDCPRRMSERDLPSRVDSERTIPSSKSVPALHHISPNSEQPRNPHDVFNPGYSRTSSNNSINTNSAPPANGPVNNQAGLRSRSTHNLHQQDGGFYQNLSVYRNKIPSPQQLGDRTSALRSSQNSLQSSVVNSQRPASAYYPPPMSVNASRSNLHQSIPNLKSPPSTHRIHNEESRSGSYPSVNQQHHPQNYPGPNHPYYYDPNRPPQAQPITNYPNNVQHVHSNGQRQDYNNVGGLLREDMVRQSQNARHEEIMRYLSTNNARINEQNRIEEMRVSKSDDLLKHHQANDLMKYASSGNIRAHESSKVEIPLYRMKDEEELDKDLRMANNVRSQKLVANAKQQRVMQYQHPNNQYYAPYNFQMAQNTQSMQNLNLNQYQYYPTSPTYKSPPVAPKPSKRPDEPPELPPTSTHPLYSASSQDPPKMAFYPTSTVPSTKTPRDPWAREEQERQAEARREASRQWQEQQIRELMALPQRTPQQEEQLRVLQLEREFQRRAMEAAEQDDDDTEKESPSPSMSQPVQNPPPKQEPPPSILKPGAVNTQTQPPPEPVAPPPPERGSSFAVMSMRAKENTKRVSFDTSPPQPPPNTLQLEETVREDPNSFIRQAESMLASPTTPTDASPGAAVATPGVIGAQEVYRDPRARRLAEQAQQKNQTMPPVPEKLSFKEKMKMFAMETGEQETPKDKSKISRAQREIDNLGSPSSGLVH
ncbi:afadin isoform X2 [Tribolium castaneum]|uniref:afadin isoform X2 n=1 Tax=Tribolium castaneum TaxID=7070 RepID=UPI0030FE25E3